MSRVVLLTSAGESVKRGLGAAMVAVVAFGVACTGSARPVSPAAAVVKHPPPRQALFGFDTYVDQQPDFEPTRLVRLDPVTLRDQPFSSLKLGDATSGHVFSPDRRSMAVGDVNDRRVVVIDLVGYRVAGSVTVTRPSPTGWSTPVQVVSWPRPDRLLVYTQPEAAHTSYPAQLIVVDPTGAGRVVRTEPLGGSVIASTGLDDGRAAFLVAPAGRVGKSRLVIADPDGNLHVIALPGTPGGFGTPDGYHGSAEDPGLAVVGGHAYVVGSTDRVADVDLGADRVRYHAVPGLMADHVPDGPPLDPGSGGIMTNDSRTVAALGGGLLSVTGYATRPAHGDTQNQSTVMSAQIVDTKTWQVRRTLHDVTQLVAAHGLYYCWLGSPSFSATVLEALRPDGRVAFRRTARDTGWEISAGRLFEWNGNPGYLELDPLTGRVLRHVAPTVDAPLDLVPWTRP
ncbi:MAG: hypothetical protein JO079_11755 [Frankiaceae bacterium]|nr:hypothetical protein [Frankiaceae bacterium]MBV9368876.1 hypothetical protein [Frankiales bacterium]